MAEQKPTGYPSIDRPWLKYYGSNYTWPDPKLNLTDYLKQKNTGRDSFIAISYYGNKITYGELFSQVDNASKVLTNIGVSKGNRILYLTPNIPETGFLWLGAVQLGAISDFCDPRPDSLDMNANAKKILDIIQYEKISYIVSIDLCYVGILSLIEQEMKEAGIKEIIILSASDSMNFRGVISYFKDIIHFQNNFRNAAKSVGENLTKLKKTKKLLKTKMSKSCVSIHLYKSLLHKSRDIKFQPNSEANTPVYIGHTSGTSNNRPKPIILTNENLISSTEQIIKADADVKTGETGLHILPFFSPLGANNNYIVDLAGTVTLIDVPEFQINHFGYLLKKYHPNAILGTPSWITSLVDDSELQNSDLSWLHRVIYGGDSMSKSDEKRVNKWLCDHHSTAVVEKGHGMSEYGGCGSYAHKNRNLYDSIGIPLPDTIYTCVDPDVEDKLVELCFMEKSEYLVGELAVSSPAVTAGVLDDQVIVPHYELNGQSYIRTRDIVKMNHDGVFFFEARKDRSFTRYDGYKIKPYVIEEIVKNNAMIRDCIIAPYFDQNKKGLMPIAHLLLADSHSSATQDMKKLIEDIIFNNIIKNPEISSRQIPSRFRIREHLPLTKNSKVDINALNDEEILDTDFIVEIEETNLNVGNITIKSPNEA